MHSFSESTRLVSSVQKLEWVSRNYCTVVQNLTDGGHSESPVGTQERTEAGESKRARAAPDTRKLRKRRAMRVLTICGGENLRATRIVVGAGDTARLSPARIQQAALRGYEAVMTQNMCSSCSASGYLPTPALFWPSSAYRLPTSLHRVSFVFSPLTGLDVQHPTALIIPLA